MKIGIDGRLLYQTGIGTYLRNFFYFLDKEKNINDFFYIYLLKKDFGKINFRHKNIIKREANFYWHSLKEQWGFLKTLKKDNLDLMHFTYFSYPVLYDRPFIATIHDTTPLRFKTGKASTKNRLIYEIKHLIFRYVIRSQVNKSLKIITPTLSVKKDLISLFGKNIQDKIIVIGEGINLELIKTKENLSLKKRFFLPFFISIANFYPHKNIERLIYAFSQVNFSGQLVLIGPDNFFAKRLKDLVKKLNLEKKIIFFFNPTVSDLKFFYKNALALINPSLSEGFGLPLVEAGYFSCPVIASNIQVFKEIMKGDYLSFNPYKINEIAYQINYFLVKKPNFNFSYLKKFSFQKMTKEILKVYQKL